MTRLAVLAIVVLAFGTAPVAVAADAVPTARLVSVGELGQRGNGSSGHATVSDDGRYVAFSTSATNLGIAGNIAVRDMRTGTLTSVDVTPAGTRGNGQSQLAYISGDGRFVAFNSTSSDLVPGDTNAASDVFLRDLATGTTQRVSVSSSGEQANAASSVMGTSRDGRVTLFISSASNLSPADPNGAPNLFVHDSQTGATFPVDVDASGVTTGSAAEAFVSGDGKVVEFMTTAALSPADTNGTFDVYVRVLDTGTTTLVSSGVSTWVTFASALSDDGRYAGYGIFQPSTPTAGFIRDTLTGTTSLFNASAFPTGISADGTRFAGSAGSLVNITSVWIHGAGIAARFFPTAQSYRMNMSPDGEWATIVSRDDAVLGVPDPDGFADAYLVGLDWPDPYVVQAPITVDATGADGAVVTFSPTVIPGRNPVAETTCAPASGSVFPVGTTVVRCVATDTEGVTGETAFTVTVRATDTTPPSIGLPGDLTVEATGPTGALVSYTVTFTDPDDAVASSSCAPSSGSLFGLGSWQVVCSAEDTHGNDATASFKVDVVDTTAPALAQVPSDIVAEATSAAGAVVGYSLPTASDVVDGIVPVTCDPAPGTTFSLGVTEVECSSSDAHGNTGVATFEVEVVDTTAPVLTQPSDVTVDATSPAGAVVAYTLPAAHDAVDGVVAVSCAPAAGSVFPIGSTQVTCTARDAHGNGSSVAFVVHVRGAADQLVALSAEVAGLPDQKLADSLTTKLEDALLALEAGKTKKACASLGNFGKQVARQSGKEILTAQASEWQAAAARISSVIGC